MFSDAEHGRQTLHAYSANLLVQAIQWLEAQLGVRKADENGEDTAEARA